MDKKVIIPTKEEIIKMLEFALTSMTYKDETMGELLGMKWTDSLLPKMKNEPDWEYEGLREFYKIYNIELSDSIAQALAKIK